MSEWFQCDVCHLDVEVAPGDVPCPSCRAVYRFDDARQKFVIIRSDARRFDIVACVLAVSGVAGMCAEWKPARLYMGLAVAGLAVHYINGLRTGVLTTRFFFFYRWGRPVYNVESPTLFQIAAVVEGLILLALVLIWLLFF